MMQHATPVWARKIPPEWIRRLYESDAQGFMDEALADEVGVALLARCDSMIQVTYANLGRPVCFVCRTPLPHSYEKSFLMICENCGWQMTVGDYGATYKNQTLNGVGCLPELEAYVSAYPNARGYAEKMRLIDGLIHAFHGNLSEEPSRPVAQNVIDGNIGEIAQLIYTLAYGENSVSSQEALATWLSTFQRSISRNIDPATGTLRDGVAYLYENIGKKGKNAAK